MHSEFRVTLLNASMKDGGRNMATTIENLSKSRI